MRLTEKQFLALAGKSKLKTKLIIAGAGTSHVKGWRTIGGKKHFFKSLWEINYAHFLEYLKRQKKLLDWAYEPKLFRFPKENYNAAPFFYKPDFLVSEMDGTTAWHEVKGWLSPRDKKKLKRFHKHFPEEGKIILINKHWFAEASKKGLKRIIPGWESLGN